MRYTVIVSNQGISRYRACQTKMWPVTISLLRVHENKQGGIDHETLCEPCGYIYDPEVGDPDNGIEPGTEFADLPDEWVCPVCGLGKDEFVEEE